MEDVAKETSAEAQEPVQEKNDNTNAAAGEEANTPQDAQSTKPADEAAAWKDKYLRSLADYDNLKKRTAREREETFRIAAADVLKDVTGTADTLARALDGADMENAFVKGVALIYDGLMKALARHGATPLATVGEPFNPEFHQAMTTIPSADVPEGNVVAEMQRGWMLNGKLLREAQVVVSAGAPEVPAEEPAKEEGAANG